MGRTRTGLLLAALLVGVSSCLVAAEFFEEFGSGWNDRWTFSADEKYSGRFTTDTPKGWDGPGLKVGVLQAPFVDEPSRRNAFPFLSPCFLQSRRFVGRIISFDDSLMCITLTHDAASSQKRDPRCVLITGIDKPLLGIPVCRYQRRQSTMV